MIAWLKQQWAPILLTLIACSVLLTNLGGQDLTLDEPDTIAVARTIGTYGFPSAWDGTAFIDVEHNYTKIGENYVWTWHPWLQHYIAYGMLLVPGIESSNIGALRLPFALFGIGTVLIAYALTQSLYNNRKVSFLVGLSIMLCLPFFLHIRQIRYYAPTTFFSLVCANYYIKVLKSRSCSQVESFLFIGSFVGLFLSNYVAWGSSALLLGIALIYRRKLKLLCYVMLVGLGAFTWYIYFQPYAGDATRYIPSFIEIAERVGRYFFYVNSYISPGVILTFAGVLALIRRHWLVGALILWVGTKIVLYASLQTAQGRYIVDVVRTQFT